MMTDLEKLWELSHGAPALASQEVEETFRSESDPGLQAFAALEAALCPVGAEKLFEVIEEIGQGGMGIVSRAQQRTLLRSVAIKSQRTRSIKSEQRAAFIAEALITGHLEHPNIVPVHELCEDAAGRLHIALKLVSGKSWRQHLEQSDDLVEHLEILLQVMNAVAFAHSRGVLHLDLKPSNVMLGEFGEVLLMDWGLAAVYAPERLEQGWGGLRPSTAIRTPCGTPAYMPAELAEGRGADLGPWTDIYMLGGLLYRLLAGHAPHRGQTLLQVIVAASRGQIPPLDPEHPAELVQTAQRALQLEPAQRFSSIAAMQEEIRAYLRHRESLEVARAAGEIARRCADSASAGAPLEEAARDRVYAGFAEAIALFQQARKVGEHPGALAGLGDAHHAFAEAALQQGDLGLAEAQWRSLAQLETPEQPQQASPRILDLQDRLRTARAQKQRAARAQRRLRVGLAAAFLACLLLVLGVVLRERNARSMREAAVRDSFEGLRLEVAGSEPAVAAL